MRRPDPDHDLSAAGVPGDPDQVPDEGTARVQSRLTGGGSGIDAETPHDAETLLDQATDQARGAWHEARERGEHAYGEARDRVDEVAGQAGGLASRARHGIADAFDRAADRLEERTGLVSMIHDNPVLAAGCAFGVGFLVASETGRRRSGIMGRATGSLRSALLGGVSTMLMQELQEMMDEHGGPIGLFNELTGRRAGDE